MQGKGIYLYYNNGDSNTEPSPAPTGHHRLHTTPGSISSSSTGRSGERRVPPPAEPLGLRTNFSVRNQPEGVGTPPLVYDDPILEEHDPKHLAAGNFDSRSSSVFVNSIAVVIGAAVGIGLGLLLAKLEVGDDVQQWIALPGNLFVRALRCLVVPLVFCSMTVSIAEVIMLNRTSVLTLRTVVVFFLTSSLAAVQGMIVALAFRAMYSPPSSVVVAANATSGVAIIGLKCANGLFLGAAENGSVACFEPNTTAASAFSSSFRSPTK
ncbi:hypothetical protein SDRG_02002 [Saprolegnia diclina VS20]|uniref:Amino acid transporter n=1 Tax=Saprolegnia diclina (strain VS20) TaxID=1156394 RepID=T0QS32_SAPDV|nr:hypothetical protein SDRG_02002 [Saprolegnia diclina VS20]EQC40939.1 hypothetical protein SDRG_02002 [Saprolegnia diclina VS20]|eukprot:XP_008605783.1 hypothetical protein SDRG_02002 [Saprolegnia diclina VS20]